MDVEKAKTNQLANIETRTGKKLSELVKLVKSSGLAKHGEVVGECKFMLRAPKKRDVALGERAVVRSS